MANLLINSDLLEGIERQISWVAPMGIRPPGVLAAWLVAAMTRFRPLLGECVDSTTASQTVGEPFHQQDATGTVTGLVSVSLSLACTLPGADGHQTCLSGPPPLVADQSG